VRNSKNGLKINRTLSGVNAVLIKSREEIRMQISK